MKRTINILLVLVLVAAFAGGCASTKGGKSGCGCPNRKGFVGY